MGLFLTLISNSPIVFRRFELLDGGFNPRMPGGEMGLFFTLISNSPNRLQRISAIRRGF